MVGPRRGIQDALSRGDAIKDEFGRSYGMLQCSSMIVSYKYNPKGNKIKKQSLTTQDRSTGRDWLSMEHSMKHTDEAISYLTIEPSKTRSWKDRAVGLSSIPQTRFGNVTMKLELLSMHTLSFSGNYLLNVDKATRSSMVREDRLPDVKQVITSDMGMRYLYRNQVITETDHVRAVFEYMLEHIDDNVDGGELQSLLILDAKLFVNCDVDG